MLFRRNIASPDLAMFKGRILESTDGCFGRFARKPREVFFLNEIEDFTLQEIADQKERKPQKPLSAEKDTP